MISQNEPYVADLTSCDREPIHHINAIQSIGFLLVLSSDWRIARTSANISQLVGLPIGAVLGAPLRELISSGAIHTIRNRLGILRGPNGVERCFGVSLQDDGPLFDLAIHRSGDLIVIEAEPTIGRDDLNAGAMVRTMLERIRERASFMPEAARLMQALTGFDRVMIYRFHPDGSGEVIAERVQSKFEPFLGLRYPAGDIPQQARALLIRNKVRILVDVDSDPIAVLPVPDTSIAPLDLSLGTLRAHSKMCVQYLKNMGVGATLTVSLVCDGRLWGLISCHHMSARHVGFEQRTTAELFGEILSLLIEKTERAEVVQYEAHTQQLRQRLIVAEANQGTAFQTIAQLTDHIADMVPCDGFAIYADGVVTLTGDTPTASECAALRDFLDVQVCDQIFATAELRRVYAPAQDFVERAAGMLVVPILRTTNDYLVFFRHELAQAVTWAGRPGKQLVVGPDGPGLSPRHSFAAWREIVRGQSSAWTPAELAAVEMMRNTVLEVILHQADVAETASRAAMQKQEMLIAELNHRVRNILALIRALVAQSRLSAHDVDTFAAVLGDRIYALARAHDQITAKNWGPSSLALLIATEAGAFLGEDAVRVFYDGPATLLQPHAFSTVALVIHELMTNAAKHGALASAAGKVAITWELDPAGNLILDWVETGGPAVVEPTRRGFGSAIIYRSIPHELDGEATVEYKLEGLNARFVVPARHALSGDDLLAARTRVDGKMPLVRLAGAALLVEDNIIIALEAEDMLLELGAKRVMVAKNVAEALQMLENEIPNFALLDINLGTGMSWLVASRLRELGVPYVFATGYGDSIDLPLEHRQVPVIAKPYSANTIARILSGV